MNSIMSGLPNDIIIHILKERRIMKQTDKYKKNYNFVLKEIKRFDKKVFRNLIKYIYEKRWDTGSRLLIENRAYKTGLKENRTFLMCELNEIFDIPFENPSHILEYIKSSGNHYSQIFVESSDEDN